MKHWTHAHSIGVGMAMNEFALAKITGAYVDCERCKLSWYAEGAPPKCPNCGQPWSGLISHKGTKIVGHVTGKKS